MGKLRKFRSSKKTTTTHFNSPTFALCDAEFENAEPGTIRKRALVMVEGEHIDSQKRKHTFGAERIKRIVDQTNAWLGQGGRVPWQLDHKKTQDANIGDLEGELEARVITAEDLPDPRLKKLIGKMGAFTNDLVGKGKKVVDDIVAGNIKTLSPGIDITTDIIQEITATPKPAIIGLSTFALTMEAAEAEGEEEDAFKESFEELGDTFLTVVGNIYNASEDELSGQEPQGLLMQAVEDYSARILDLLGLGDAQDEPYAPPPAGVQGARMPDYLPKQQGLSKMGSSKVLAAFTLADMQKLDTADFIGPFTLPSFQPPQRRKEKKGSLLGKVAKGALAVGAGAAALRYGGAGLKAGIRAGKSAGTGLTGLSKAGAVAGASVGGATRGIRRRLTTDIGGAKRTATNLAPQVRKSVGNRVQGLGRRIAG